MVNFELIVDECHWNERVSLYSNSSPYQLFGWGQYKKKSNWNVISIHANKDKKHAFLQITYKVKFGVFFGWCVGSIVGDIELFAKHNLIEYIKEIFNVRHVLIKSSFTNQLDSIESLKLFSSGWDKSIIKISTDYSIYVDLSDDIEKVRSTFSKNFKRNIKRAEEPNKIINISLLKDFDEKNLVSIFNRFKELKDIATPELEEICIIKKCLGDNIIVATSEISGQIVGLRACLFLDGKAIDFWAATDSLGRKNYTSYILLFSLLKNAKSKGVNLYDMGGVDPRNNNSVFSFKNGTRAKISERLGHWEISSSKFLSFLIDHIYIRRL